MKAAPKVPLTRSDGQRSLPSRGPRRRWIRAAGLVWALLLTLVACVRVPPPPETEPTIVAFDAAPTVVVAGSEVALSWVVEAADTLRLLPGDVDVTGRTGWTVRPDATTTYTLLAANGVGEDVASLEVRVVPSPRIEAFGPTLGVRVLPGAAVDVAWTVVAAEELRLTGPGALDVDVTGLDGYTVAAVDVGTYVLTARSAFGEDVAEAALARLVRPLLVAGQSNAQGVNLEAAEALTYVTADEGVFMLGNDDVWKVAYEPLDDCTDQVDTVGIDPGGGAVPCVAMGNSGVSMGVALGNALTAAVGDEVLLIPAARGGSSLVGNDVPPRDWEPLAPRESPDRLFGSAVRRWRLAEALGATTASGALVWYQGESETTSTRYPLFQVRTDTVLDAFTEEIDAPILFVQLSRYVPTESEDPELRNLLYQQVRERQRAMETGSVTLAGAASPTAEPGRYLVVTHDLPMFDRNHLSPAAQIELGRRVALAFREHVLGEAVDGTGPRLIRIDRAAGDPNVYVRFDRPVTAPATPTAAAYAGYFRVYEGSSEVAIESIERDGGDPATVRLRLAAPPSSVVSVRYMPPATMTSTVTGIELDVIRSGTCAEPLPGTEACLPAPAFGDATGSVSIQNFELPAGTAE
jgi:hypothetical protein